MKLYVLAHSFMRRYFSGLLWYCVVPGAVFLLTLPFVVPAIYYLEKQATVRADHQTYEAQQFTFGRATQIPQEVQKNRLTAVGGGNIADTDYRAIVLDEFFRRNDSPLYGYGKVFVEKCDQYGAPFDCTTLPAIAWVETRLCGYSFSHDQRNCWGFGGSGPNRIWFDDYEDAIDLITDRLVNAYGPQYMTNPESMQHVYCGPHCNSWGPGVQSMRYTISNLAVEMGYPPLIRD
ncbi:MAG: hypothetical protein TR69_WS6001000147 [candidate division WS6 bacterium OLB20]|uniref:Mannosyl-glycoprotein endo-beta-N-acetylglucosamidase-like domain-containing protein n=1 Tax=candidate division WS6 bacterium OLB20 TaxID=1617426 RepID=A0A136M053_9BACT|nr:MAG: hypothetical protein TR69_WS6001000147 [candidate division WS6 bacterium OLB20]